MTYPCYYETPTRFIPCKGNGRFTVEAGDHRRTAHWMASACEKHLSAALREAESFTGLRATVRDRERVA